MNLIHLVSRGLGLSLALLACSAAFADEVDDYVETQRQWLHIPGLSLAVVKEGKIIKAQGYGLANVETDTRATPDSVFKIGSVSKQFLAAAIMLLAQDGKIGLDDSIGKYLDATPDAWKDITIRHLLTHTSGLVREVPGFDPFKAQPDTDVVKAVASLPLRFAPGEKWEYSNVGYYALAEIIHRVSSKPWGEFVADRLFAPTGMSASRTTTADIVPHRASGYSSMGHKLQNAPDWIALRPSGAFLSTVLDLAKWDAALSTDTILKAAIREQMWTPVKLKSGVIHPYGFGWFVDTINGHRRIRHDGGLPGFSSDFERFVDDRLTIIVLVNTENRDLRDLALRVAGFYLPVLLPPVEKPIVDNDPQVTARIKSVIEDFANSKLDTNRFTPELASGLSNELKAGFGDDVRKLGTIQSLDLIEQKNEGDNRVYRYRLNYQRASLFVLGTFNKENKIIKFAIFD
jgi:CubicO group peptidase (beta-lactamase class C family)